MVFRYQIDYPFSLINKISTFFAKKMIENQIMEIVSLQLFEKKD